jgi:hypothetical protein
MAKTTRRAGSGSRLIIEEQNPVGGINCDNEKNRLVKSQSVFFDLYAESLSAAQIGLFHVIVLT